MPDLTRKDILPEPAQMTLTDQQIYDKYRDAPWFPDTISKWTPDAWVDEDSSVMFTTHAHAIIGWACLEWMVENGHDPFMSKASDNTGRIEVETVTYIAAEPTLLGAVLAAYDGTTEGAEK